MSSCLNANKISSNVSKTELAMFNPLKKQLDHKLEKLNDKKLYQTDPVNDSVLGHIGKNLTWKYELNNAATKLNKANAMLFRIRHYVYIKTLKSINRAIFELQFSHSSLVWAQNSFSAKILHQHFG